MSLKLNRPEISVESYPFLAVARHLKAPSSVEIDGVDKKELRYGRFLQHVVQEAVAAFSDEIGDIEPSVIRISLKADSLHTDVVVFCSFFHKRSSGGGLLVVVKDPEMRSCLELGRSGRV